MNNYNLTIKGKILILQVVLMSVFTFCATKLQAKEVILVKKEMNSYLESGEEIDMAEGIQKEKLASTNEIKALKATVASLREKLEKK